MDPVTIKVLDKGEVTLLDVMGGDSSVTEAARISYASNKIKSKQDDKTLLRYLMRSKHTSCFEMVEFKFYLKCPIFLHNQLVRHRMASQNVMSGRYSEMPNEFYVPEESKITLQSTTNKQGGSEEKLTVYNVKNPDDWWDCLTPEQIEPDWKWSYYFEEEQKLIRHNYERWLKSGCRTELARINLPLSTYTQLYWKIDLHNLLHFLELRLSSHAQYETRIYAQAILNLIQPIVPQTIEAFKDYVLNSITFSAKEIECLKHLIKVEPSIPNQGPEKFLTNKRELEEFNKKINILLGQS